VGYRHRQPLRDGWEAKGMNLISFVLVDAPWNNRTRQLTPQAIKREGFLSMQLRGFERTTARNVQKVTWPNNEGDQQSLSRCPRLALSRGYSLDHCSLFLYRTTPKDKTTAKARSPSESLVFLRRNVAEAVGLHQCLPPVNSLQLHE